MLNSGFQPCRYRVGLKRTIGRSAIDQQVYNLYGLMASEIENFEKAASW